MSIKIKMQVQEMVQMRDKLGRLSQERLLIVGVQNVAGPDGSADSNKDNIEWAQRVIGASLSATLLDKTLMNQLIGVHEVMVEITPISKGPEAVADAG